MGRKRTATYKRARRAKNKAQLKALISKPRDPNRPTKSFNVAFFQRRNQMLCTLKGTGILMEFDDSGRPITQHNRRNDV